MKVFVVLQSFSETSGGNASCYGVFKSRDKAVEKLPQFIIERFSCNSIEEFEKDYEFHLTDGFIDSSNDYWIWDRDEEIIEFYIQETELED